MFAQGKQMMLNIQEFFIGVAVWTLIKEGITWTMITDPWAKLEPRQEYILLFLSVLAILWLWWIWFKPKKTYFFPFKNLTHNENYDGITAGFTDILTKEYQDAESIREIMDATWGHEFTQPGLQSTLSEQKLPRILRQVPVGFKENRFVSMDIGKVGDTTESPVQLGEIKLWAVSFPLELLRLLLLKLLQQKRISGNIQKHGSVLSIYVQLTGTINSNWHVRSDTLPESAREEDQLFHKLAHHLVYKMVWRIIDTPGDDPQSVRLWVSGFDHFWCYLNSGSIALYELKLAQNDLEKAIELTPKFALAHHHLGLVYNEQALVYNDNKRILAAIEQFDTAIDLEPGNAQAHFNLAQAYSILGMLDKSIIECQRAIHFKPDFIAARCKLADLNKEAAEKMKDELSEEIEYTNRMKKELEEEPDAYETQLKEIEQFYDEAVAIYTWIIDKHKRELKKLRCALIANEQDRLADEEKLSIETANAYIKLGNTHESIADYYQHIQNDKKQVENYENAIKSFDQALSLDPKNIDAFTGLSRIYFQLNNIEKAIKYLIEAQQIDPESPKIKWDVGRAYLYIWDSLHTLKEEGEVANEWGIKSEDVINGMMEAIIYMEDAYLTDPLNFEILNDLADAHLLLGKLYTTQNRDMALKEFDDAIALQGNVLVENPLNHKVYEKLAIMYGEKQNAGGPYDTKTVADAYETIADTVYSYYSDPVKLCNLFEEMEDSAGSEEEKRIYLWVRGWLLVYRWMQDEFSTELRTKGLSCIEKATTGLYVFTWDNVPGDEDDRLLMFLKDELGIAWMENAVIQKSDDGKAIQIQNAKHSAEIFIGENAAILNIDDVPMYSMKVRKEHGKRNIYLDMFKEAELTHHHLGIVYLLEEKYDKGIIELEMAGLSKLGNTLDLMKKLAESYYQLGQYDEAIGCLNDIILRTEGDLSKQAEALASRAQIYFVTKDSRALEDCREAAILQPMYDFPYYIMGLIHMERLEYDLAEKAFQHVIELKQQQLLAFSHHEIADALRAKGIACDDDKERKVLLQKARYKYQEAIAIYSDDEMQDKIRAHVNLAELLDEMEQFKEAGQECDRALAFPADLIDPQMHAKLGYVLSQLKRFLDAETEYETAIRLSEEELKKAVDLKDTELTSLFAGILADACNNLAYHLYAEMDMKLEKGLRLIDMALDSLKYITDNNGIKKEYEASYMDTRAWLHYKTGDYTNALEDLKRALYLTMGTQEERYHLAMVYEQKMESDPDEGERKKAREEAKVQWAHVRDIDLKSKWGKTAVERLRTPK
jgi:tetratricopeptide (TPR) repeat protein